MKQMADTFVFEYFRSIDHLPVENESEIFLGFVTIIKKVQYYDVLQKSYFTRRVDSVDFLISEDVSKVDPILLQLPKEDVLYLITEETYKLLESIADTSRLSFWCYRAAIKNQE